MEDTIYYLEKAPVSISIAYMSIPMMLGMATNMIYNIMNVFYISRLNNIEMLAAITFALPFTTILMAIGNIFGTGGSTYISRLIGENNLDEVKKTSSVNLWFSFISGIIFMLICFPLMTPILHLLGASGESFIQTKDYIMFFTIGSPFIIANFTLEQTVRGEGASKISMAGMIISVIVNMLLDPIFIFLFHFGVLGAAIATVIANVCAVAYYIYYLKCKSKIQSVDIKDCRPNKIMLCNIFKVGISAFLLDSFLIISSLLFNNYAASYGDYVVGAFGVSQRVVQISELIGMGLYMGVTPLIAFAYSSGDFERLKEIIKKTVIYLIGIIFGLSAIIFIFRSQIIGMFNSAADVISTGSYILEIQLIATIFAGCSGLFTSIFQAFGKGIQSNIMSITRGIAFIPILILGNILFHLDGVICSLAISEMFACMVGLSLWLKIKKVVK